MPSTLPTRRSVLRTCSVLGASVWLAGCGSRRTGPAETTSSHRTDESTTDGRPTDATTDEATTADATTATEQGAGSWRTTTPLAEPSFEYAGTLFGAYWESALCDAIGIEDGSRSTCVWLVTSRNGLDGLLQRLPNTDEGSDADDGEAEAASFARATDFSASYLVVVQTVAPSLADEYEVVDVVRETDARLAIRFRQSHDGAPSAEGVYTHFVRVERHGDAPPDRVRVAVEDMPWLAHETSVEGGREDG